MDNPVTQAILGITRMTKTNKTQKQNTNIKRWATQIPPQKKPSRIAEKRLDTKSVYIELQTKCFTNINFRWNR